MVALSPAAVPAVWAEVDPRVATSSRGPETGSVPIRTWTSVVQPGLESSWLCLAPVLLFPGVVATRTSAGGWNATSAKPPSLRGWEVVLHFQ